MSTALETNGLGKRYGRMWALRDCSLRLPTGLVGPNGAGKTTLLHLAVGLVRPDAGAVRVLGHTPGSSRELLAQVGFVAQDTPLYRDFTVTELTKLGEKLNDRWDSARPRDRLRRLNIPLDRRVGKLSPAGSADLIAFNAVESCEQAHAAFSNRYGT